MCERLPIESVIVCKFVYIFDAHHVYKSKTPNLCYRITKLLQIHCKTYKISLQQAHIIIWYIDISYRQSSSHTQKPTIYITVSLYTQNIQNNIVLTNDWEPPIERVCPKAEADGSRRERCLAADNIVLLRRLSNLHIQRYYRVLCNLKVRTRLTDSSKSRTPNTNHKKSLQ